jgi:hypothetical protein
LNYIKTKFQRKENPAPPQKKTGNKDTKKQI